MHSLHHIDLHEKSVIFLQIFQNLLLKVVPTSHYKDTWNI